MNPDLLPAYYWLSSAIAQAFAALIALTAMFYIYRRTTIDNKIDKLLDSASGFIAWGFSQTKKRISEDFRADMQVKAYRTESKNIILSRLQRIIDEGELHIPPSNLKEKSQELIKQYTSLDNFKNFLKSYTVTAITLSAIAMASGIVALLIGWWIHSISLELTLDIMIFESFLALFALGWTVAVVIRMLKEPKEPKAEARQE